MKIRVRRQEIATKTTWRRIVETCRPWRNQTEPLKLRPSNKQHQRTHTPFSSHSAETQSRTAQDYKTLSPASEFFCSEEEASIVAQNRRNVGMKQVGTCIWVSFKAQFWARTRNKKTPIMNNTEAGYWWLANLLACKSWLIIKLQMVLTHQ